MPPPQIWPRRQKIQWVLVEPTPIEGVERTNIIVVGNLLQEQGSGGREMRRNSYTMEIDRSRNCYSCGGFRHLARNCRNRGRIEQERKLEYGRNCCGNY